MSGFKATIDGGKFPPTIKIEVEGHKGGGCINHLEELQSVLKATTQTQTLKPEFKEVRQKLPMRR